MSCFIRSGNVVGSGGDIWRALPWGGVLFCLIVRGGRWRERDARGRWHRSGQGLRRGILLGLRETAKSIAAGPELAFGSDSRPCRNNAVSRSPSSNHPSSAAARPDATFLWLTLPADRKTGKKPEHGMEAYIKGSRIQNTGTRSAQHTTINIVESRNQIGTAYHHKYRRSQQPNRHNVPP